MSDSTPRANRRPAILTATAVMAIIVASLSALNSLSNAFSAAVFGFPAPKMSAATTTTTAASGTTISGGTAITISPTGFGTTASPTMAPAAALSTPAVPLTPTEVQTVVQRVQARLSNTMNPAQVATLTTALGGTSPQLVPSSYIYSPVQTATKDSAGAVDVAFTGGSGITIDSSGAVIYQTTPPTAGGAAFLLNAADSLASLVLAVALLVAAVLVFRNSPRARWLLDRYAWFKIPVAVVGAMGTALMYGSIISSVTPAPPSPHFILYLEALHFGIWLALGLAFPIAVILVLRTKTVRGYYHGVAAG